jgi:hypothetical protein
MIGLFLLSALAVEAQQKHHPWFVTVAISASNVYVVLIWELQVGRIVKRQRGQQSWCRSRERVSEANHGSA